MKEQWDWRARAWLVLAGCCVLVALMFIKDAPAHDNQPTEPVEEPDCD